MRKKRDEKEIFEVALNYFSKNGYKKTTLEEIAKDLNMTNANLYSYFAGKSDLYVACVSYALDNWQNKLFKSVRNIGSPSEQLVAMCANGISLLQEDKRLSALLREDRGIMPSFTSNSNYHLANEKSVITLRHILTMGVKNGEFAPMMDVDNVAAALFKTYKSLAIAYAVDDSPETTFFQSYDSIMHIIMYGLLARKDNA